MLRLKQTEHGSTWKEDKELEEWSTRTVWQYRLEQGAPRLVRAYAYAVVADQPCTLPELAHILHKSEVELRRLNPRLASDSPSLVRTALPAN